MRNLVPLTDDQIEEAFDHADYIENVAFTRDTFDDFIAARKGYAEAGKVKSKTDKELVIDRVQPSKGDMRVTLHVIDFGEVRGALKY